MHTSNLDNYWAVRPFYKLDGSWNPNYDADLKRFKYHVALINDLMLELTRSANYVIDLVRETIDPLFRKNEGYAVVTLINNDLTSDIGITHYRGDERSLAPYTNLEAFKIARSSRDGHYGSEADIS